MYYCTLIFILKTPELLVYVNVKLFRHLSLNEIQTLWTHVYIQFARKEINMYIKRQFHEQPFKVK